MKGMHAIFYCKDGRIERQWLKSEKLLSAEREAEKVASSDTVRIELYRSNVLIADYNCDYKLWHKYVSR